MSEKKDRSPIATATTVDQNTAGPSLAKYKTEDTWIYRHICVKIKKVFDRLF